MMGEGHSGSGHLVQYLTLMGFSAASDGQECFLNDSLFDFTNHRAFQQIFHFLLQKLDGDRCATQFRFCWPVIDNKMAAEFRKVAFDWYNELQKQNPARLPATTFSKFLNPGGHRFRNFLMAFVRFVVSSHLCRQRVTFLDLLPDSPALTEMSKLIKALMSENVIETRREFEEAARVYDHGESLVAAMNEKFNLMKCEARNLIESEAKLKKDATELTNFQGADLECDLEAEYSSLKATLDQLLENLEELHNETKEDFETVNEIVHSKTGGRTKLNLVLEPIQGSAVMHGGHKTLSQLFTRLFSSVASIKNSPGVDFPDLTEVASLVRSRQNFWLEKEKEMRLNEAKLEERILELEQRVLPEVLTENVDLFPRTSSSPSPEEKPVLEGIWSLPFILASFVLNGKPADEVMAIPKNVSVAMEVDTVPSTATVPFSSPLTPVRDASSASAPAFISTLSPWVYEDSDETSTTPLPFEEEMKSQLDHNKLGELMSTLYSPTEESLWKLPEPVLVSDSD